MRPAEAMQQDSQAEASRDPPADPGRLWMLAFQRGDDAAFRNIVLHYGGRIVGFFRRSGADPASAEDLAQEVFLRIARARDRYVPTAKFSTWLHQILARIAMNDGTRNRWRRAVAFKTTRELDAGESGLPELAEDVARGPAERVALGELKEQVRAAIATLPNQQRTALLLHRFEGCSYDEVGAALGLSLPAVKSLLFRARENLKLRLAPLLNDEPDSVPGGST